MAQRFRPQGRGRRQSGDRKNSCAPAARQPRRSRRRAWRRRQGFRRLEGDLGLRSLKDHAQGRRPAARAPRHGGQGDGAGTGQDLSGSPRRDFGKLRNHRMVRRGGSPRLRAHRARPRQGRAPACRPGAGRHRRRVHAVEFPDAHSGAQDRRRLGGGLRDHHQGFGRRLRVPASNWSNALPMPACRQASSILFSACRRTCRNI